ncbi:hypothetical protein AcW2_000853 [Taiwanofungus camphoratus]|nr:hypothetical protein AcW2_000853 [Antrodia cinnamomea]
MSFSFSRTPPPHIQLSPVPSPPPLPHDEYDDSDDPEAFAPHRRTHHRHRLSVRSPFLSPSETDLSAHAADRPSDRALLFPHSHSHSRQHQHSHPHAHARPASSEYGLSPFSSVANSPVPSRTASPAPPYSSGASSCSSDSDGESELDAAHFLDRPHRHPQWREDRRRWWITDAIRRRRHRETVGGLRTVKRGLRLVVRHPFFPKTPVTILLTLLLFTLFGVSLTFLLIYILNPDKEPLPWRGYCTIPPYSSAPPPLSMSPTASFPFPPPAGFTPLTFPPPGLDLDALPPAGVFVGVFSMDNAVERRMLIRSTWASHLRSRNGAGAGDGGVGTSRTVVRFILGTPRREWDRRIRLEMEMYNDMVILPIVENMNAGKSWAYFQWAAYNAWVPPLYFDAPAPGPSGLTYTNTSRPPLHPAHHDPAHARHDYARGSPRPWVRPDYVVKTDDDSFVMLAELEARLRVELHARPQQEQEQEQASHPHPVHRHGHVQHPHRDNSSAVPPASPFPSDPTDSDPHSPSSPLSSAFRASSSDPPAAPRADTPANATADPLVFWGYLVKNRFMAGELYALSYALVDWVAHDPQVRALTKGAEDKQTSKWMRLYPRADEVRWASERCWIYDHPRAGTVYSHGFLFPSEVKRVQRAVVDDIEHAKEQDVAAESAATGIPYPFGPNAPTPPSWAHSTVTKFGSRYSPPLALSPEHSIEALVEGSEMSMLHEGGSLSAHYAWRHREGRQTRYEGQRVGGTVVVHFIKKNMWFLETAAALLLGEEVTEEERRPQQLPGRLLHAVPEPKAEGQSAGAASLALTDPHARQTAIMHRQRRR